MTEHRRPQSVLVVVYEAGGTVLLLRRARPFDFWQSVTGSLLAGESHAEAAARELYEETGLEGRDALVYTGTERVFSIDPRWRHRYPPGVSENREFEWRCRLAGPEAVRLNAREHSEFQWTPLDDAIGRVWSWTNRDALIALRESP